MNMQSALSGIIGRRELVDAIATGDPQILNATIALLGLSPAPTPSTLDLPDVPTVAPISLQTPTTEAPRVDSSAYPANIDDIALWLVTNYQRRAPLPERKLPKHWHKWHLEAGDVAAEQQLVTSWHRLAPRLRHGLSNMRTGKSPDIRKLVTRVARRELIVNIPRKLKRCWGGDVYVIHDFSTRLTGFAPDHREFLTQIRRLLPQTTVHAVQGSSPANLWFAPADKPSADLSELRFRTPPAGSTLLVLGDLGCLARDPELWRHWLLWGRQQQEMGHRLLALVPCGSKRVPSTLRHVYAIQTWQPDKSALIDPVLRNNLVEQLLVLASPTLRLEPGLLRHLRALLPAADDGSLEIDVWNSELLAGSHPDAATIDRDIARQHLLPQFERLSKDLREQVLACIRNWRMQSSQRPELWFAEVLCLPDASRKMIPQQDVRDAQAFARHLYQTRKSNTAESSQTDVWTFNVTTLFTREAFDDPEVGWCLRELHRDLHSQPQALLPGTDLRELRPGTLRHIQIDIDDATLTLIADQPTTHSQRALPLNAGIRSSGLSIELLRPRSFHKDDFWKTGKPGFVSDFGTDEFGAWCEFQVPRLDGSGMVTQRLRWIPAGTFLMGSPENEAERDSDEIPHEVALTRGYWLADTACPQELWQAVMGNNPSRFAGDDRPVECVSNEDVSAFLQKLAELVPGLSARLPTEAQWEYACRAGTTTPFSFGETITTDQANFDGNYRYADGPKGEYREETVGVKALPANRWGLYQMHGNVVEWCSDWYDAYSSEPQSDPVGPSDGSSRVIRGGSWFDGARVVRSAVRNGNDPGDRYNRLGFRLLSSASAEPTEAAEVPVAEQGSEQTRGGEADEFLSTETIWVGDAEPATADLATFGPIRVRSNLEQIVIERCRKPSWAVEFARDRFGVYADFEVPAPSDSRPVRQRMRWIPPGYFEMGSPEAESGRYDEENLQPVTISSGFWMFDTACTQRLWLAVMQHDNPSEFPDPERPVEMVAWDDCVRFAQVLTDHVGLQFSLPTEAQWEYACRAGTSTAIYTGDLEILGDANAPALDAIAWYGGNCGHEYDFKKGEAVIWLSDKQYEFEKGGTRHVKQKAPNPWGLHDMLGNVYEWCSDWYGEYSSAPQVDPVGPPDGSDRVVRGGGWINVARLVRSASRGWHEPGFRYYSLGFRLLSSASQDNK